MSRYTTPAEIKLIKSLNKKLGVKAIRHGSANNYPKVDSLPENIRFKAYGPDGKVTMLTSKKQMFEYFKKHNIKIPAEWKIEPNISDISKTGTPHMAAFKKGKSIRTVQEGVDPKSLVPVKDLSKLDRTQMEKAVKYAGDESIKAASDGYVMGGHHRLKNAIEKGRAVDVEIVAGGGPRTAAAKLSPKPAPPKRSIWKSIKELWKDERGAIFSQPKKSEHVFDNFAEGRNLNTIILEIAKKRGGLLTSRDIANIQKWKNKIGDTVLSKETQGIIFASYKAAIKKNPWHNAWNKEYAKLYKNAIGKLIDDGHILLKSQKFAQLLGKLKEKPTYSQITKMLKKDGFKFKDNSHLYTNANGIPYTKGLPAGVKPSVSEIWVHPEDLSVVRVDPLGNPTGIKDAAGNKPHIHFESWNIKNIQIDDSIKFDITGKIAKTISERHWGIENYDIPSLEMKNQIEFNKLYIFKNKEYIIKTRKE